MVNNSTIMLEQKNDAREIKSEVPSDTEHKKTGTLSSTSALPSRDKDQGDHSSNKSSNLRVLLV